MSYEPHPFLWSVSPTGYAIVKTRSLKPGERDAKERKYLTDGRPVGLRAGGAKLYQPLKEFTGLFRNFVEIGMSEERVLDFAERHGLLGHPLSVPIEVGKDDDGKGVIGVGEEAFQWMVESRAMHHVVQLWDAICEGNLEHLGRHVIWDEKGVRFDTHPGLGSEMPDPPFYRVIATIREAADVSQFDSGDLIRPALSYIQKSINEHLKDSASPKLLWHENETKLGLFIVPLSLLGALWLQFAEAVNRNTKFRECSVCGKWFEIAAGSARSDKQFCSAYCRTKAFRERQAGGDAEKPRPTTKKQGTATNRAKRQRAAPAKKPARAKR